MSNPELTTAVAPGLLLNVLSEALKREFPDKDLNLVTCDFDRAVYVEIRANDRLYATKREQIFGMSVDRMIGAVRSICLSIDRKNPIDS